jgi:hypothetical protein
MVWLAASGCLSQPEGGGDKDLGDKLGVDPPEDPIPTETAFYLLQPYHLRAADWPGRFAGTDVFVANASMSSDDLAVLRASFPEARLLAYTSAQDVPIGLFPANPYFQELDAAFDSSLCIRNLATGNVVRIYGAVEGDPSAGLPAWVPREESIEALVGFHRDVTMSRDWDGLYVDQCNAAYPNWRIDVLLDVAPSFDFNGDGLGDLPGRLRTEYALWRPVLTQRLREELGDDVVLVANSGGALEDAALNGITLEGVGSRFEPAVAEAALAGARAATTHPFLAVLWATTPESEVPSRDLALALEGVHFGVIDAPE